MTIDGDILEIDTDVALDDVGELHRFVKDRLDYIEEIALLGEWDEWRTSALFVLLVSIKRQKPSIRIPLLDEGRLDMGAYGTFNWIQ